METAREFILRKYPELWGGNHNTGDIIRAMEEYAEMVAKNIVAKPVLGDSDCYGCKHFDKCGIRLDYGNDGCDDKEV